ncbi:unnamed protein product [Peronospora belbahrii]|uniref:SnoaL-like domain-containing protein n=1 Tax=Peronospora belbahrii TaxID=622444 RepID=A0AAU9LA51_9STRA|nr:unnamed protein product [Peronospora belbahrii]CAH0522439.1 unnamed protein product [Peronospora belbahrii]
MDVVDFGSLDHFVLTTTDDCLAPFPSSNPTCELLNSFAADKFVYEKEQDLEILLAAGYDVHSSESKDLQSLLDCKVEPHTKLRKQRISMLPTTTRTTGSTVPRHCKRKTVDLHRLGDDANKLGDQNLRKKMKKMKKQEQSTSVKPITTKSEIKVVEQTESMYRRRYDILHGILEAWNTGGIEDLEEIAGNVYDDDVILISPDYSEGLHGVEAVMSHWSLLLDAFPDGMMEEYIIQREEGSTETMKATWTFSGTQIFPILGVQPRHKKVCINGKSLFIFKNDRIRRIELSWNYGETLLKLMGVQPEETNSVTLGVPAFTNTSHSVVNQ